MRATTIGPGLPGTCLAIVASVVALAPTDAAAGFCGTPSPASVAPDDAYRVAGTRPPDDGWGDGGAARSDIVRAGLERSGRDGSRTRRLSRLLERLHRAEPHDGHGERVVCHGAGERSRTITWTFDLEQLERVGTPGDDTLLTAFESRHAVRATPPDEHLVAGTLVAEVIALPSRWYADADATTLHAERRFRRDAAAGDRCVAAGCAYLTEIELSARAVGDGVELRQSIYVNGLGSERAVWRFGWRSGS